MFGSINVCFPYWQKRQDVCQSTKGSPDHPQKSKWFPEVEGPQLKLPVQPWLAQSAGPSREVLWVLIAWGTKLSSGKKKSGWVGSTTSIQGKGASLVAQWLRICLIMQGTRVRALVRENPTCCGATRPMSHNYWARASRACAPQQERPRQWEARAPRWRVAPACHN